MGVLIGDGCLYKINHNYQIILETVDRTFIEKFKKSLQLITGKKKVHLKVRIRKKVWNRNNKEYSYVFKVFRLEFNSKIWYEIMFKVKNDILRGKFKMENIDFIKGFIKGFFDSEGYFGIYKKPWKKVVMYNKNLRILHLIDEKLKELGIKPSGIYKSKEDFELTLYRQQEVNKFIDLFGTRSD